MKTFQLKSLRENRIYRLKPDEVRAFYDDHISGAAANPSHFTRVLDALAAILSPGKLNISDHLGCFGTVLLELFDSNGELRDVRAAANLVVNTGKNAVIDRLQGTSVGVHDFQAVGTGTTAAAAGDTTLETEIGTRVQGTLSQPVSTTDRLVSTFAAGNATGALTETGRLTASSGGNLFARQVFSVVNKGASDSLVLTHDITVS